MKKSQGGHLWIKESNDPKINFIQRSLTEKRKGAPVNIDSVLFVDATILTMLRMESRTCHATHAIVERINTC